MVSAAKMGLHAVAIKLREQVLPLFLVYEHAHFKGSQTKTGNGDLTS